MRVRVSYNYDLIIIIMISFIEKIVLLDVIFPPELIFNGSTLWRGNRFIINAEWKVTFKKRSFFGELSMSKENVCDSTELTFVTIISSPFYLFHTAPFQNQQENNSLQFYKNCSSAFESGRKRWLSKTINLSNWQLYLKFISLL